MLPVNAPPSYADRETLWNKAEKVEKQHNSRLARKIVLTLPREVPMEHYPQMVKEYCEDHLVSKGMCCDLAIHDPDPPGHNPHCHSMLTMRAFDTHGNWLPKSRKVYDLDENGERIRLPPGAWKSHKEKTVDWDEQYHCEEWRQGWETVQNRYLEMVQSNERVDLRSYERQGVDTIPTVHMGPAVTQMEQRRDTDQHRQSEPRYTCRKPFAALDPRDDPTGAGMDFRASGSSQTTDRRTERRTADIIGTDSKVCST